MSPNNWNGTGAVVFYVNSSGNLTGNNVNNTRGLRPISFLKLTYLIKVKYNRIRIQDLSKTKV